MVLEITSVTSPPAVDFALRLANSFDPARDPADHLSDRTGATAVLGPSLPDQQDPFLIAQSLLSFRDALRQGLIAAASGQDRPVADIADALALPWSVTADPDTAAGLRFRPQGTTVQILKAWAALGYVTLVRESRDRLRVCQSPPCQEIFRDDTKPGRQRFCCKRCANRFNVARHRSRKENHGKGMSAKP